MFRQRTLETVAKTPLLDLNTVTVQRLDNTCIYNAFDCGIGSISKFLRSKALRATERSEHVVYVALAPSSMRCIGFYALQVGSDAVPENREHKKTYLGSGSYSSFPAVELTYLAVDVSVQQQGLGGYLLQDAMEVVYALSEQVGLYAMTLQSLNKSTTKFYETRGFQRYSEASGREPKLLYPIGTMRKMRAAAEA